MKTPEQISKDLEQLKDQGAEIRKVIYDRHSTKQQKRSAKLRLTRLNNEYRRLYELRLYLLTDPNESFLRSEETRLQGVIEKARIEHENTCQPHWMLPAIEANRKKYEDMYDIPKIKKQLLNIQYLLQ